MNENNIKFAKERLVERGINRDGDWIWWAVIALVFVVFIFIALIIINKTGGYYADLAEEYIDNIDNKPKTTISTSSSKQWFEGGDLQNATVVQWKSANSQNKLVLNCINKRF